jgi:hypothetical protein
MKRVRTDGLHGFQRAVVLNDGSSFAFPVLVANHGYPPQLPGQLERLPQLLVVHVVGKLQQNEQRKNVVSTTQFIPSKPRTLDLVETLDLFF